MRWSRPCRTYLWVRMLFLHSGFISREHAGDGCRPRLVGVVRYGRWSDMIEGKAMLVGDHVRLRPKRLEDALQDYQWRQDLELSELDAAAPLDEPFEEYQRGYAWELSTGPAPQAFIHRDARWTARRQHSLFRHRRRRPRGPMGHYDRRPGRLGSWLWR